MSIYGVSNNPCNSLPCFFVNLYLTSYNFILSLTLSDCTNDGEIMSLPSQLKDIKWESYTCKYGWHVQGIWALMKNIGQASEPTCADRSCNDLLAIGTSKGEVRLYQYPVTSNKSPFRSESLHTHDVKNCCFNSNGTFLITVGKHSKSIAVWKIEDMPKESHTIRHSSNNS